MSKKNTKHKKFSPYRKYGFDRNLIERWVGLTKAERKQAQSISKENINKKITGWLHQAEIMYWDDIKNGKMNQIKNYTTRDQIGKIINILPSESADMYYAYGENKPELLPYTDSCLKMMCLPCWSVGALLNFIPDEIEYCNAIYKIDIRKSKLTNEISIYQIAYGNSKTISGNWKDLINTGQHENLINACIDIILWLKENKIISRTS